MTSVEVSLSLASDEFVALSGVYVDDVVGPDGASTSFESDSDPLDGWIVSGPPPGSPGNAGDWRTASEAAGPSTGENAEAALARSPRSSTSSTTSSAVTRSGRPAASSTTTRGSASPWRTRPDRSTPRAGSANPGNNTGVVVHELAHQWVGDDLALEAWQHIWLNEGFATYMEWLWSEHEGLDTAQEIFDFYAGLPEDDPFWEVTIGDPGAENLFDGAVYDRGGLTLYALRAEIGDEDFLRLLRRWTAQQSGGNVHTDEFIALAERVSGEQLDDFFTTWLFTPEKPAGLGDAAALRTTSSAGLEKLLARPGLRR